MKNKTQRYLVSLCTICVICAIVIIGKTSIFAQSDPKLTIFAASSLSNVFDELADTFSEQYSVKLIMNYGASSTLVAQLLQGASADIFASANEIQMQILVEDELVNSDSIEIFAENELTIIVPSDNPAKIQEVSDLAKSDILLVFAAPNVPIRAYTDTLLDTLELELGKSFSEAVLKNVVSEETNVRQIVTRVVLGEADAGIVYRSDIRPDIVEQVQTISLPAGTSPRAVYPIATLKNSLYQDEAAMFIEYILSDSGQTILTNWGFCSPQALRIEVTPEATAEITPELQEEPNQPNQLCED